MTSLRQDLQSSCGNQKSNKTKYQIWHNDSELCPEIPKKSPYFSLGEHPKFNVPKYGLVIYHLAAFLILITFCKKSIV